jgi:phage repressor protein C with HTH and peptisase S24 domain
MPDVSMNPIIKENSYVFVEINGSIKNKEIGLFRVNDQYYIRKLIYKKGCFILKATSKNFDDIKISNTDDFQIIGKIYI